MNLYDDLFNQINNAVLDLQAAQYQTFQRPLKVLANLLRGPALEEINRPLLDGIDFDAFINAGEKSGGSMVGSHQLVWPDDQKAVLGLTLMLIDKLASDPDYAISFSHHYFYTRNNHNANLNALTRQLIILFARDYKNYVLSLSVNRSNA